MLAMQRPPQPELWPQHERSVASSPAISVDRSSLLPPSQSPPPYGRRAKSNSERGKEFRAKRRQYEGELERSVAALREQVAELDRSRSLCQGKSLHARFCASGSLAKLVREYFTLFKYGLRDPSLPVGGKRQLMLSDAVEIKARHQENFLRQNIALDAVIGDFVGPEASIQQWRLYTTSHDRVWAEIDRVVASGSEDHPTVELFSRLHARISRNTFRLMFPGVMHREDLHQKFLHREVTYKCVHHFEFTPDGKIAYEVVDVEFVEGLLEAGCSLMDVAELMQASVLTPHCLIPDPMRVQSRPASPASASTGDDDRARCASSAKLRVDFLLAADDDVDAHSHVEVLPP